MQPMITTREVLGLNRLHRMFSGRAAESSAWELSVPVGRQPLLDLRLYRELECVIRLEAQIPHRAFELGVAR